MRHWLGLMDAAPADLHALEQLARQIKAGETAATESLREKLLVMVFFNPSLRTRASFEAAMLRFGGHGICLNVGGDTWNLEHRPGIVMSGACAEHIREAAPVLGRYGDALAVRTFAGLRDVREDASDAVLRGFAEYAGVPVVSMESSFEHPCQGLADWLTMAEQLGELRGRTFTLSWAPHVRSLPLAVPHSAVLAAAAAGMQVRIAHPRGYDLHADVMERVQQWCRAAGTTCDVTDEQRAATREADIVYVKSWGSPALYGQGDRQAADFEQYADWQVTPDHLGRDSRVMHCLPVRRNVVIADSVLDSRRSVVVDQAENRMWAQAAILSRLLKREEAT